MIPLRSCCGGTGSAAWASGRLAPPSPRAADVERRSTARSDAAPRRAAHDHRGPPASTEGFRLDCRSGSELDLTHALATGGNRTGTLGHIQICHRETIRRLVEPKREVPPPPRGSRLKIRCTCGGPGATCAVRMDATVTTKPLGNLKKTQSRECRCIGSPRSRFIPLISCVSGGMGSNSHSRLFALGWRVSPSEEKSNEKRCASRV